MTTLEERFWAKVNKTDTCWLWTAAQKHNGYGSFTYKGKTFRAHRLSYELLVGPIPAGLVLDHLCRVRHCVNPAHLEVVTMEENKLRGLSVCNINAAKTHCKHGHEFTAENTWLEGHWRRCRTCRNKKKK